MKIKSYFRCLKMGCLKLTYNEINYNPLRVIRSGAEELEKAAQGWLFPDPMGQHFSPYLGMSNNPVSFIDPTGGWDIFSYLGDEDPRETWRMDNNGDMASFYKLANEMGYSKKEYDVDADNKFKKQELNWDQYWDEDYFLRTTDVKFNLPTLLVDEVTTKGWSMVNHTLQNLDNYFNSDGSIRGMSDHEKTMSNPIVQAIHQGHKDFSGHPVTQGAINTLTFVATGGVEGLISLGSAAINGTRAIAGRFAAREAAKRGSNIVETGFNKVLPTQDWINPAKVAEYKSLLQSGQKLSPINAYRQGGKVFIEDGHHRFAAYMELGMEPNMIIRNTGGPVGFPNWLSTTFQAP